MVPALGQHETSNGGQLERNCSPPAFLGLANTDVIAFTHLGETLMKFSAVNKVARQGANLPDVNSRIE
ncbi:hypothetical protein FRC09_016999 [Ceratobasidium sp. 395]|nr:hypothetical protein FRC09_016999 [Ceratobasidium sp. 395]